MTHHFEKIKPHFDMKLHVTHLLVVVSSILFVCPLSQELQIVNFFPSTSSSPNDSPPINFTHLTIDPSTGNIYVGATNWLYQLNSNLSLHHAVKTGPVVDGPMCSPIDCSGVEESTLRPTNNTNKVLVIDPSSQMLIVCGSIHQGSCRRHSLSDIRKTEPRTGVPVAANDENSSTVAFVGLAKYYGVSYVLYVAATNSKLGPYRELVPAISSRSLEPGPRLFSIIEKSFQDMARVDISYHMRDYFIVKYIHAFQSGEYVYFASVQKKSHFQALEEWGHVTRLARVCSSDAGFHTYTEMTISCIGPDGTDFSLLQDATVVRASPSLAHSMGISEQEEIFIGTFATPLDHSSTPSGSSAVCMFPLKDIERGFTENIHLCYTGSVTSRNMDYIAGSMSDCPQPTKSRNAPNFCNEPLKLNGSIPLQTQPFAIYPNTTVTAITVSIMGQKTFAFLGTSTGSLKKVEITSASTSEDFYEIQVDPGHSIQKGVISDPNGKFLFIMSSYKVAKIRIDGHEEVVDFQNILPAIKNQSTMNRGSHPEYSLTSGQVNLPSIQKPQSPHIRRTQQVESDNSSYLSPMVVCLLSVAAVAVLVVVIVIGTTIRRKGSGSSSFTGNDRLYLPSDAPDLKFPPPLISSNTKPLPLIPLTIDRDSLFEKGLDRTAGMSPPGSQVNAIYSEINELNIDRRDDAVLIPSSSSSTGTEGDHHHQPHPLINHHSSRQHLVNQLSRESASNAMPGSNTRVLTAYPPFITFNTIGRSRNSSSNPYTFHDSMSRITKSPVTSTSSALSAVTVSKGASQPQTYTVYTYDKLSRGGRGRDSKGSFTSSSASSSPSTRDRFV